MTRHLPAGEPPAVSRVLSFGIYSVRPEYPRQTNLIAGLQSQGIEVLECRETMFDTSGERLRSATTLGGAVRFATALARSYAHLARVFPRDPGVDAILLGYPGCFHAHLARRLRDRFQPPAVLLQDVFFPLHDAVVADRRLLRTGSLPARGLRHMERHAYRASDALLIDTATHADAVAEQYQLPRERVRPVWVGPTFSSAPEPVEPRPGADPFRVVFVGTYIPLHGIDVILEAAKKLPASSGVRFEIVGSGQLRSRLGARCRDLDLRNVALRSWVDAADLRALYRSCDLGLGVFGTTEKTARVIPIKVFDMCAAGIPFVTADTPAVREIFRHGDDAWLVPPGSPGALAAAILYLRDRPELLRGLSRGAHRTGTERFGPESLGAQVLGAILEARQRRRKE